MSKKFLWPLALLALSPAVLAQQPPGAGGQLLQIPPTPILPRAAPEFRIEQRAAPADAPVDQVRIVVRTLRVTGASIFPEAELIALTGFRPGSELALSDLQAMALRITDHYRHHGYFVAQAFVPAQEIKDNAVSIAVSEGRYGAVTLRNATKLSDRVASGPLEGLRSGDVISSDPLETRLLLLSDIPGVNVKSTLVPGTSLGTSDLLVDVTPGQRVTGSIDADNGGSRYTGAYRLGATVNLNNPLGLGDVASLRVLTAGEGLNYARAAYQVQVGRAQVGVAYSILDYSLGREFEGLDANGTAKIATIFGRYPIVRSRNDNLYAQLAYDAKSFQDKVDSIPSVTDRKSGVLMASLYGDHRDSLGGGGLNSFGLTWSAGKLDIETPAALTADAATARTNGHFNKLSFNAMRLQSLGGPFSLYGAVSGQFASKNLDLSEKMELGGMYAVRAYPEGEAYADQGVLVTLEAPDGPAEVRRAAWTDAAGRLRRRRAGQAEQGSVDHRRQPKNPQGCAAWASTGPIPATSWCAPRTPARSEHEVATSAPDKSGRFWLQLVKYF